MNTTVEDMLICLSINANRENIHVIDLHTDSLSNDVQCHTHDWKYKIRHLFRSAHPTD